MLITNLIDKNIYQGQINLKLKPLVYSLPIDFYATNTASIPRSNKNRSSAILSNDPNLIPVRSIKFIGPL